MSVWSVNLVSAFGRGETLALALNRTGFHIKIIDFTNAFTPEFHRGPGPFPLVDKAFMPTQREYLKEMETLPQGLTFWLKDGPIELNGPCAGVHIHSHPEVQAWKTNDFSGDFAKTWLQRFLRQWAAPELTESWATSPGPAFPAEAALGMIPIQRETQAQSFERARAAGIEILPATRLRDVHLQSGRIFELELDAGSAMVVKAQQWIWCLSSFESQLFGQECANRVVGRLATPPDWAWLSFNGKIQKGPWCEGLPQSMVVLGDVFLPWYYANAAILQREDETRIRAWMKVPRHLTGDIDARRTWALDLQKLMLQRLKLADWKFDSAEWSVCPHSEVFSERSNRLQQWKNWHPITPDNLDRLDVAARLQREAEVLKRIEQWRSDQQKKQGDRRDQALHPA